MTNGAYQSPSASGRFLRFLGVGVVNTCFGYAVFCAGLLSGLSPSYALALQFGVGIPFNYLLHGRYVFGVGGIARLPLYAISYLALYSVNLVVLERLDDLFSPAVAQAILILPMAGLSFIVLSRLLR